MGKSLFEFSKEKREYKQEKKEDKQEKVTQEKEDELKKKITNYSKLSENELMKELYKEVGKQKSGGNFDMNQLSSQLENVKPMLNKKQNENLERILKNLK